ncbi:MAG: tellurite resistance TerB family protein [Lysobacterales bacterium]|jgi:uncharacterized membrane protein YebE (DUF533 family)
MDINKVVSGLSRSGVLGGLAGGALSGAIMSNKKARKGAGTLLKAGGIAALGAVAWQAYKGYKGRPGAEAAEAASRPAAESSWDALSRDRFEIDAEDSSPQSTSLLLVQAMIAAAGADGHMDGDERRKIMDRVVQLDLAADEKSMVFDSLNAPLSMNAICDRVDSQELAVEVYLASLMVVDRSRSEAALYLDALAYRLGLPEKLVAALIAEAESQAQQAAA